MKMTETQQVAAAAWRIRRYALQMGEVQGQGYIYQALGYADVLYHRLQPRDALSSGRSAVGRA